jgi:hypothetical protein
MKTFYDAGIGRMLSVEYDYEPEGVALLSEGMPMEPEYADRVEIMSVMIEGVEVIDLLDEGVLTKIEKQIRSGK